MEAVLNVATELAPILEDHNFYIDQRLATMPRRLVLAVGRRLVSRGILNDPADVFYLHAGEVRSALESEADDYTQIVGTRKQEMARWAQVTPPPFIGAPPPPSHAQPWQRFWGSHQLHSDQPNVLPGNGGSAGVARGPARVLLNLGEAHRLRRGDVLVARTTMPPWTPLFAVASALVVETGGILSHAAVAAREYGLPAVLGVTDATRLIRDGQLLEVDGSTGTVRILS
jgi:pyruvate,water dikinase